MADFGLFISRGGYVHLIFHERNNPPSENILKYQKSSNTFHTISFLLRKCAVTDSQEQFLKHDLESAELFLLSPITQ